MRIKNNGVQTSVKVQVDPIENIEYSVVYLQMSFLPTKNIERGSFSFN